jgi:error-prone DNA polymerase
MAIPNEGYAELHCLSNFSFQRGASSATELFERARRLGYEALAITDECSLAGIVRAWQAARERGVRLIVGSEIHIEGGPSLVLLAENLLGYQRLCRLISLARLRATKGCYQSLRADFEAPLEGLIALWRLETSQQAVETPWLCSRFPGRLWLAVALHRGVDDAAHLDEQLELARQLGLPAVATGAVHMHARGRRALQDVLTAIGLGCRVSEAGHRLYPNGERHLRNLTELEALYPAALRAETLKIAALCQFELSQLRYQYPRELVPDGQTPTTWLRALTARGLDWRWPSGVPEQARQQVEHELEIIGELGYESYFLTVYDIVRFAREQGILCQGRGSAANSVVCFVLGITELNPMHSRMLFARFLSRERKEPPDIDVDFEHERREEVIQYVFRRYGRSRAALTAVASSYQAAGAVRDVGKALGLPADQLDELARTCGRWASRIPSDERLREAGFDPDAPLMRRILVLSEQLIGFPRHLSQHPGGFVISEQPLDTLVPLENAAMAERTVIQWDKDDLDAVGLLKVDVLALGMLTALRRTFDLLRHYRGRDLDIARIPADCAATYAMIGRADTVGVFQIESRAQMAMLPRLRPRCFYDLVIEVAIVRPGPIQGDMVHPYLRRRNGEEPITCPPGLEAVFGRTLGVPLFQEQVMELAIVAADYSPGEADQLRRSMAAWKRHGGLEPHQQRLMSRMLANGYDETFAARIFEQIKGFGSYGFPESHAASFALLTYASCWLKCHEPAAFTCALINSWPMGFYTPDQLLQDARRHAIDIRPVDVMCSDWACSLEPNGPGQPAIRLGLCMVRGLSQKQGRQVEVARARQPFSDVDDLCRRAGLDHRGRALLADAGALQALAGHRYQARWAVTGVEAQLPLFTGVDQRSDAVVLAAPSVGESVHQDYASIGTTLGPHPLALLRAQLTQRRCRSARDLANVEHGRPVAVAGLVIGRQRPQTASGVVFVTLEDEFGMINVLVWRDLAEHQRQVLHDAQLLQVNGRLEQEQGVRHVIAGRLEDLTPLLDGLQVGSRDFH